ncbi:MAG: hypothetical protein GY827_12415 [Cytophagales bacterium]|nr:hypothetical protein [Cytophagales bacterium]
MSRRQQYILTIIGSLLLIGTHIFYFAYLREQVGFLYEGKADTWFQEIIEQVYPRFEVEKHRFNLSFFLEKSQQVILRVSMFVLFLMMLLWVKTESIKKYFNQKKDIQNEQYFRVLFYACVLIVSYDWFPSLLSLENMRPFYHPISFLKVFGEMPPIFFNLGIYLLMVICSILCIFNIQAKWISWIVITCFIYLHGLFCSFEKMNHVFTTFIYVGLLFPFSFHSQTSWNIQLLRIAVCLTYFFAGTEKLLISQFAWVSPDTFRSYLLMHEAPLGLWVAKQDFLCYIFPSFALGFQLTFCLVLLFPKLTKWYLLGGWGFHWGTTFLFGISWLTNPWLMPYLFFIDWKQIILWIKQKKEK